MRSLHDVSIFWAIGLIGFAKHVLMADEATFEQRTRKERASLDQSAKQIEG
jgi:hypothetical protein